MTLTQLFLMYFGVLVPLLLYSSVHTVDEGYVGMYWRGGALLPVLSYPGFNFKMPFITTFAQVQTSVQTDKVQNVHCGTSGGVMVLFEKIEVVNRLHEDAALSVIRKYGLEYDQTWIFSKIEHEINQFCSSHTLQEVYIGKFDTLDENLAKALQADADKWAPGIEIIATRVTKPVLPTSVKQSFEKRVVAETDFLIRKEMEKLALKESETSRIKATLEAQQAKEVKSVEMDSEILQRQARAKVQSIQDAMQLARQRSQADAELYRKSRQAEVNQLKLSREYVAARSNEALRNIPKTYYTSDINHLFQELQDDGVLQSMADIVQHVPEHQLAAEHADAGLDAGDIPQE